MRLESQVIACLLVLTLASVPVLAEQAGGKDKPSKGGINAPLLVAFDNFENGTDGWPSPGSQALCSASDYQLGVFGIYGSGSVDPLSKTYTIGVEHTQVRIQATVSFLDNWQGEMTSLSVDGVTAWVHTWHHCPKVFDVLCQGFNVCGDQDKADRLGQKIDIVVPHSGESLTLTFQTNLSSLGDNASLLVDDIRLSAY